MRPGIRVLAIVLSLILLGSLPAFARGSGGWGLDDLPIPEMIYPVTENVDLTGQDYLEFQWKNDLFEVSYFEFKLYKGYGGQDNLIVSQKIESTEHSIKVEAAKFQDGQTYTWILKQVGLSGVKSEPAFRSFRVTKK